VRAGSVWNIGLSLSHGQFPRLHVVKMHTVAHCESVFISLINVMISFTVQLDIGTADIGVETK